MPVHMLQALKYRGSLAAIQGSFAEHTLRDLQKRAEQEHQYTFVFREGSAEEQASASTSLKIQAEGSDLAAYVSLAVLFLLLSSMLVGLYVIILMVWNFFG